MDSRQRSEIGGHRTEVCRQPRTSDDGPLYSRTPPRPYALLNSPLSSLHQECGKIRAACVM